MEGFAEHWRVHVRGGGDEYTLVGQESTEDMESEPVVVVVDGAGRDGGRGWSPRDSPWLCFAAVVVFLLLGIVGLLGVAAGTVPVAVALVTAVVCAATPLLGILLLTRRSRRP